MNAILNLGSGYGTYAIGFGLLVYVLLSAWQGIEVDGNIVSGAVGAIALTLRRAITAHAPKP